MIDSVSDGDVHLHTLNELLDQIAKVTTEFGERTGIVCDPRTLRVQFRAHVDCYENDRTEHMLDSTVKVEVAQPGILEPSGSLQPVLVISVADCDDHYRYHIDPPVRRRKTPRPKKYLD